MGAAADRDFHLRFEPCSKSVLSLVSRLGQARVRREHALFKAEGEKCVHDTIEHFRLAMLFATPQWLNANAIVAAEAMDRGAAVWRCSETQMERMSDFRTAPPVIAVYELPEPIIASGDFGHKLAVALDGIQDPGNMGSILRTCDWFGVHDVVCSAQTVDIYNPKVVQATMGAISRMRVAYVDELGSFLAGIAADKVPVYGTFLNGDNLFGFEPPYADCGVVVMGNEGKGVTAGVAGAVTHRLTIPSYPAGVPTSESLNVGAATAVVLSYLRMK